VISTVLGDVGALGTAVGAAFIGAQIGVSGRQARTQFEDGMTSIYRGLVAELPVQVFFDQAVAQELVAEKLSVFYRYFDLCNEQAFLHEQGRVSDQTWRQWRDGIEGNITRSAFKAAWAEIGLKVGEDFQELRRLLESIAEAARRPFEAAPEQNGGGEAAAATQQGNGA
jgi:hypothetical protein